MPHIYYLAIYSVFPVRPEFLVRFWNFSLLFCSGILELLKSARAMPQEHTRIFFGSLLLLLQLTERLCPISNQTGYALDSTLKIFFIKEP